MNEVQAATEQQSERHFWGLREQPFFLILAILIGVLSGLAVVCFRLTIEFTRLALLGSSMHPPTWRMLLMPSLAGLIIALLVVRFFPRVRGSGVNQTKAAVYIYDGYIPFRTVVGKFWLSALAVGSGHSLGPEDPSLQVGAGLASAIGRRLGLSRGRVRLLAPLGAAAGLAAAFNAPISAVLFVIEEVIGNWSAGVLGAVVLSAVSSVVVARWFFGPEPLFQTPQFQLKDPLELSAYAVLGVVGGLVSVLFVKLVLLARQRLKQLPHWTQYLQPAVAGFLVGVIGIRFSEVMGAGYHSINEAMHDQYTWQLLLALALAKLLATMLSFVSGTPGGMFAPTLFMGAMLGGAVGGVEHIVFPHITGSVGAFALVGMGTMFAGILRAPLTSVFMMLEVSGNYEVIIPVIISNTLAYLVSRSMQKVPIFDALSRQDGLDLPSMEEKREETLLRVEDAMRVPDVPVFLGIQQAGEVRQKLRDSGADHFLISFTDGSWAYGDVLELDKAGAAARGNEMLVNLWSDARLPHLHPDHPLEIAMRYKDWAVVPVVHRANFAQLVGLISLADVLRAYAIGPDHVLEPISLRQEI
ncbi:MAG TPA: chloride channel protein [Candidatus Angelobacter sp.]|nr:chloride channel protein [Candidatus Angelobacter sp.]